MDLHVSTPAAAEPVYEGDAPVAAQQAMAAGVAAATPGGAAGGAGALPPAPAPAPAPAAMAHALPAVPFYCPPQYAHFEIEHNRYQITKALGTGAFGTVVLALDHAYAPPRPVAIKWMHVFPNLETGKRVYREMRCLTELSHPCVARLLRVPVPRTAVFTYLAFIFDAADLDAGKLLDDDTQILSIAHVRFFAWQLLLGLVHTHSAGLIHRDLKPQNLLLDEDCSLRIADYGLARTMGAESDEAVRELQLAAAARAAHAAAAAAGGGGSGTAEEDDDMEDGGCMASEDDRLVEMAEEEAREASFALGEGGDFEAEPEAAAEPAAPLESFGAGVMKTKHVVTRYYRAPEVALTQGKYDTKADVFSAGCIMAEFLGAMLGDGSDEGKDLRYRRTRPLIKGAPCSILSTVGRAAIPVKHRMDQIEATVKVLGWPTPEEEEVLKARCGGALPHQFEALRRGYSAHKGLDLAAHFPLATPDSIALVKSMLKWLPEDRPTAQQALDHPFFEPLRAVGAGGGPHNPAQAVWEGGPIPFGSITSRNIRDMMLAQISELDKLNREPADRKK